VIVTLKSGADAARVQRELTGRGLWVRKLESAASVCFWVEAHSVHVLEEQILQIDGVAGLAVAQSAHPLVDAQSPVVEVAGVRIGAGAAAVLMAGPCAVESEAQIEESAKAVASSGAVFLRGGAYKPRTSPYSFQGLGIPALHWLRQAADRHALRVVTEALAPEDVGPVADHADLIQVGSRNMQNFALLQAVGRARKPVLLKRSVGATLEEWLLAAEHCLVSGSSAVIFCERGIRGFDPSVRNFLDLSTVALLSHVYHQPVIVDPSHAAGRFDLVAPLSRAALAAGAHGLLVEIHPNPESSLSDGPQALSPEDFHALVRTLRTS
jgi:3-deoxy-7-phosphoheptulonate synthase